MATLTAPQLVNLRTKAHRSSLYLSVFQPATLLTAQVNNGSIARGARSIAYDTGTGTAAQFATIEAFQLLEVDTATGTEYARIRAITGSQVSGTITVDENAINWGDNNALRIKHFYPMIAVPPSIRSGVFYKFYNLAYSDQNSEPNPVAIIGSHLVGVLSAGSVAFSLNSSSSYAIAQGATISSRVWSCVKNGGGTTGISFSSTTAANPTLTITAAGQYWLNCTITDSNGKTQSTWRAVFVYSDLNDAYIDFTVSSLSGDWNLGGWQASVEVNGVSTLSSFPDGALAVIHYKNYFDATEGYVDLWGTAGQNIVLSGYIRRDQDNDNFDDGTGRVNFDITTPDGVMDNMSELGSISLNAKATPNKWWKYASWLTVGRGVHHLLKWHSSVLETCDVLGLTDNTLGVKSTDFTEPSILQMVNGLGFQRGHFAKMVSSRLGRLYFATDSQMLNTAGRAALDTVFTLATSDISGTVDVVRQPEAVVSVADLDGFSFDGSTSTPFISIIPGYRESSISYGLPGFRGTSPISAKSQVLDDQTDSNEKVGRVFAQANNNPLEMRFTTPANYLGAFDIVPSIGWYEWGIIDASLKRNLELFGRLLICRNITQQIDTQSGTIQTSVVFEPEAFGPDGVQGNYPVGYPTPKLRPPSWDEDDAASSARFIAAGWRLVADEDGKVAAGKINSFDVGAEATFDTGSIETVRACGLTPTKGLLAYRDTSTGFAQACTVNISDVTVTSVGAAQNIALAGTVHALVSLSETLAVVCYDTNVVCLTITGDTVTVGTPLALTDTLFYLNLTTLDADRVLFVTSVNDPTSVVRASVLSISGTTITQNTIDDASAINGMQSNGAALTSSVAVIGYRRASNDDLRACVLYNIGTGYSLGDDILVDSTQQIGSELSACRVDDTRALIAWPNAANDSFYSVIVTYDGSTGISAGSLTLVKNGSLAATRGIAAGALSSSKVAVVYQYSDGVSYSVAARSLTIAGPVISNDNNEEIINADTDGSIVTVCMGVLE